MQPVLSLVGMQTTDQPSDRITNTRTSATPWYRVRPALVAALAMSVSIWLGLIAYGAMRTIESGEFLEIAARLAAQHGGAAINLLAVVALGAVAIEGLRTSHRLRNVRRKLMCSLRAPHGSRAARA